MPSGMTKVASASEELSKAIWSKPICTPFDTQSERSLARASAKKEYENASVRDPAACCKVVLMRSVPCTPAIENACTLESDVQCVASEEVAPNRTRLEYLARLIPLANTVTDEAPVAAWLEGAEEEMAV